MTRLQTRVRIRQSTSGFTIIETMVAASLAVMMIGIVAGLIAKLHGRIEAEKARNSDKPWQERLAEQLQAEFSHCQSVVVEPNQIIFDGFFACDNARGYVIHEPARIMYKLTSGSPSIVLRTEELLLARVEESNSTGISRFELLTKLETDVPPGSIRIRVHFQNESARRDSFFDLLLFRHGV
jgi:hypothetical protein